jgi:hypothetical protein
VAAALVVERQPLLQQILRLVAGVVQAATVELYLRRSRSVRHKLLLLALRVRLVLLALIRAAMVALQALELFV